MCVPLGIHLEPINRGNAVSNNIIIINSATGLRENCTVPNKKLFGPMVHHINLSKTLQLGHHYLTIDRSIGIDR